MRRPFAALVTALVLALVLFGSGEEQPAKKPGAGKFPAAIGAIHPRLSPDGATLAFSYQGEIWTAPRAGGTMTLLTPSEGFDTEPAWSPDGKRIAFLRGSAVKLVEASGGKDGSFNELSLLPAEGGAAMKPPVRFPARIHDICWKGPNALIVSTELGQAHDDLWELPTNSLMSEMKKLTSGQADEDRPSTS